MENRTEYIIKLADRNEREEIYKIRYNVYAVELNQHPVNQESRLTDDLDSFNTYILAKKDREIAGFLSITPPHRNYSIDKYLTRNDSPFIYDDKLYEVRILTIIKKYRNLKITLALMYAAAKWIENSGGKNLMILGRVDINDIYKKIGFQSTGIVVKSGEVHFDVMGSTISKALEAFERYRHLLDNIYKTVKWSIGVPFYNNLPCYHGGAFFKAIGASFENISNRNKIINADVLDAWFDPCPEIVDLFKANTEWILKTSPPIYGEGLVQTISRIRGMQEDSILINNGSSSLMYLALNTLLDQNSKVLVLDPSYGEYQHICENVIRCRVDRFELDREKEYTPNLIELKRFLHENRCNLFILVNPNNPSGKYIPKDDIIDLLNHVDKKTLIWIDETYIDYAGPYSLESLVNEYSNLIVCKSMSKAYALSGVRVAYLCAHPFIIKRLKNYLPPWPVSLPAQIAAVIALSNGKYYQDCYMITHENRRKMVAVLRNIKGLDIIDGTINSILIFAESRDINQISQECQKQGLFIRLFHNVGKQRRDSFIRISVKDETTNIKICDILKQAIGYLHEK